MIPLQTFVLEDPGVLNVLGTLNERNQNGMKEQKIIVRCPVCDHAVLVFTSDVRSPYPARRLCLPCWCALSDSSNDPTRFFLLSIEEIKERVVVVKKTT